MKLVTYRDGAVAEGRLGAVLDGLVIDVEFLGDAVGTALPSDMLTLIDLGPDALSAIHRALAETEGARPPGIAVPEENVRLLAPIPRPRKNIFGIGLNYVEHVAESAKSLDTSKDLPKQPVVFSKPPTSVIATGEPIQHNASMTQMLDWEVELAVIIGKRATRISKDDAMSHVFGYSVINDVSARDNRRAGQWIFSKGQDSYCPFGPAIVTADDVADPHDLTLWLKKNGEEKQRSNTKHLLFDIPTLISDISSGITLEPGDIIATGTPSGVGAGRDPQEWMWPGDVIECGVDGIGVLRNPVVKIGD
ncbi:fumarylacetoacetate hydrolase family protein [Sagittula stellata]|uniref:Fumarylacetoacetate hydrolase family protein n=1 Tax=Sagittula stellata (strain ATCC 700073 / DSM 11524 / E-37) TaxID=388399 RepID=A3K7T3_SAGS3|nr:fumarylacetoacetate hydrolase family protein [Sagittula stellata]EBA06705.1 fumarylacetoacetate hydrolase family protein [Sagittula stellata E-37]